MTATGIKIRDKENGRQGKRKEMEEEMQKNVLNEKENEGNKEEESEDLLYDSLVQLDLIREKLRKVRYIEKEQQCGILREK